MYYVPRVLAFLMAAAVFVISFVFVGTVLSAPFLDLLSERTEAILQGRTSDQAFRLPQLLHNVLRSAGHVPLIIGILALTCPVNLLPVIGHALWLGLGWLLLAYDMSSFGMDRRRLSFETNRACFSATRLAHSDLRQARFAWPSSH
jgi:CysZ protein